MSSSTGPRRYFTKDTFDFLTELADNNDRTWFDGNRKRYEHFLKDPALDFIDDFRPHLGVISNHYEANARAVGGSLFRIHRDTRFSKDKTPYKTNSGIHFRHALAKDAHTPGFYLHVQPRQCFVGAGLWHPEPALAQAVRARIDEHPDAWLAATRASPFADRFTLSGERLIRPPRGFSPAHELIDDLKRKDFIAVTPLTQKQVTSTSLLDHFGELSRDATPLMKFLCDALELPF